MVQGPNVQLQLSHCDGLTNNWGVHAFGCAFGALIASFEKQKFESDRKESLPYPVFILMKWERRILQSNTPLKEVIILGGFLLLCWSGLRFSDLQRCRLSTWQLDSTSLAWINVESKDLQFFNTVWGGYIRSIIQRHVDMDSQIFEYIRYAVCRGKSN